MPAQFHQAIRSLHHSFDLAEPAQADLYVLGVKDLGDIQIALFEGVLVVIMMDLFVPPPGSAAFQDTLACNFRPRLDGHAPVLALRNNCVFQWAQRPLAEAADPQVFFDWVRGFFVDARDALVKLAPHTGRAA